MTKPFDNIASRTFFEKNAFDVVGQLNLEMAVQDDKVMQDSESKDCVNLPSSTAVSGLNCIQCAEWPPYQTHVLFWR